MPKKQMPVPMNLVPQNDYDHERRAPVIVDTLRTFLPGISIAWGVTRALMQKAGYRSRELALRQAIREKKFLDFCRLIVDLGDAGKTTGSSDVQGAYHFCLRVLEMENSQDKEVFIRSILSKYDMNRPETICTLGQLERRIDEQGFADMSEHPQLFRKADSAKRKALFGGQ